MDVLLLFLQKSGRVGGLGTIAPLVSGSDAPDCRFYIRYANYLAVKCTAAAVYNGLIVVAAAKQLCSQFFSFYVTPPYRLQPKSF